MKAVGKARGYYNVMGNNITNLLHVQRRRKMNGITNGHIYGNKNKLKLSKAENRRYIEEGTQA